MQSLIQRVPVWCEGMRAQRKLHSGAAVPRSAEVNSANEVGSDG